MYPKTKSGAVKATGKKHATKKKGAMKKGSAKKSFAAFAKKHGLATGLPMGKKAMMG